MLSNAYAAFERKNFQHVHDEHWKIELCHRMLKLKQVCSIAWDMRVEIQGGEIEVTDSGNGSRPQVTH